MATYAIIESGTVVNTMLWDGDAENWQPPAGQVAIEVPEGASVTSGTKYLDGAFVPEPVEEVPPLVPTPEDVMQNNTAYRDGLLVTASQFMTPLLVSLQLGDATAEETASAKAWQAYVRELKAVDLSLESPSWPVAPE